MVAVCKCVDGGVAKGEGGDDCGSSIGLCTKTEDVECLSHAKLDYDCIKVEDSPTFQSSQGSSSQGSAKRQGVQECLWMLLVGVGLTCSLSTAG